MILSFMFQMGLQEIVLVRHECRVGKSDWKVLKSGNIITQCENNGHPSLPKMRQFPDNRSFVHYEPLI